MGRGDEHRARDGDREGPGEEGGGEVEGRAQELATGSSGAWGLVLEKGSYWEHKVQLEPGAMTHKGGRCRNRETERARGHHCCSWRQAAGQGCIPQAWGPPVDVLTVQLGGVAPADLRSQGKGGAVTICPAPLKERAVRSSGFQSA